MEPARAERPPGPARRGDAGAPPPLLDITGLAKRYGPGAPALGGVDLAVPAGALVALVGASGSGKSTLLRCVNRLVEPDAGSVRLEGAEVTGLRGAGLRRARRRMGMLFQEHALVARRTALENALAGRAGHAGAWRIWAGRLPARDVALARALLARVGLEGLEGRRADALSGGQRQRVGLVRALVQEPALLLVDEPTASLDPRAGERVMALLAGLCRERGVAALVSLHDLGLMRRFADRVVGLRDGRVAFDGPPSGLDAAALAGIYGPAGGRERD